MNQSQRIRIQYNDEIEEAVEQWADHENMNEARLIRWLEQFNDGNLGLAIQIIENVSYYAASNIRGMTRQLYDIVIGEIRQHNLTRIAFIPVGDPGSGSLIVARVLRDLTRHTQHRLLSMVDLNRVPPGSFDALVFVDDFSGTGLTLKKWWDNVEPLVRPVNAPIYIGLLVLNGIAKECIENFADKVFSVTELDESKNIFSTTNNNFTREQKDEILRYCRRTGCDSRYEKGFGECGLLVVFKHGCPNNSLPILWYKGDAWRPLFMRRAI